MRNCARRKGRMSQQNLARIPRSIPLTEVMMLADEIDS
jgi:hypothetical protein